MATNFTPVCTDAQNCGDAVALSINPHLPGAKLPRGGLGEGDIKEVAQSYGAPVIDRSNINLKSLQQLGPGTIIRMTRQKGDKNYEYGDTHAETIAVNPNTGKLAVASYTAGKGLRYKPLNESYVNSLPKQTIATNLIGGKEFAMSQRFGELQKRGGQSDNTGFMANAMQFFINRGFSQEQAAGIVGNLVHESGGKAGILGDSGKSFGIAQWGGDRRKALYKFAGSESPTIDQQLAFIDHELNTSESKALAAIRDAKTPQEAARKFSLLYERPGKPMMNQRLKWAEQAMQAYQSHGDTLRAESPGWQGPGEYDNEGKLVRPLLDISADIASQVLTPQNMEA